MHDRYLGLTEEEFDALLKRNFKFQESCDDITQDPVRVFTPPSAKNLAELRLIREVSKDLQIKKEEDMKRAAQAAAEPKEAEKTEEKQEENKPETEK